MIRAATILVAVAALAVPAGSSAAAKRAYLSDCGKLVQYPSQMVLACADANYGLSQIGWNSWAGRVARGVGEVRANDCAPNCAGGHFHTYRAQVIADKLTSCGTSRVYLRLTIVFTGKRPKGYKPGDVHTWTCKQAKTR